MYCTFKNSYTTIHPEQMYVLLCNGGLCGRKPVLLGSHPNVQEAQLDIHNRGPILDSSLPPFSRSRDQWGGSHHQHHHHRPIFRPLRPRVQSLISPPHVEHLCGQNILPATAAATEPYLVGLSHTHILEGLWGCEVSNNSDHIVTCPSHEPWAGVGV